MARRNTRRWFASQARSSRSHARTRSALDRRRPRNLRIEPLEDRILLAATPQLVSRAYDTGDAAGGNLAGNFGESQSISADGRYIAFLSDATNLVPGVTILSRSNVYRFDRVTGHVDLVSIATNGTESGNNLSDSPVISADGSIVAFASTAWNLNPLDQDGYSDIFARNFNTNTTELISINRTGDGGGGYKSSSIAPEMSADGNVIAFYGYSTDIGPVGVTGTNIYARNRALGTTQLVTVSADGLSSGNTYVTPQGLMLSADGSVVVYQSQANNLSPLDHDNVDDIFARNLITNTTSLVSVNAAGTDSGDGKSFDATVSADGRYVAFLSASNDLDRLDKDAYAVQGFDDVYVRDLTTNVTHLVSVNASGTDSGSGEVQEAVISADGCVVAFEDGANDLQSTPTHYGGLYARDLATGKTFLVSVTPDGYSSGRDLSMSADGRMISYLSTVPNLTNIDDHGVQSIYVSNLVTGVTQLVSLNYAGTSGGDKNSGDYFPYYGNAMSADGTVVTFISDADDLVTNDTDSISDVFATVVGPPSTNIFTVDSLSDVNDGDYSAGHLSLREAVALANAHPGADTIQFSRDLLTNGPATISLTNGQIAITDALTIDGQGADELTIDANHSSRIFDIGVYSGDVTIHGVTLRNGRTTDDGFFSKYDFSYAGGAIRSLSDAKLTIDSCTIQGNETDGKYAPGGAIATFGPLDIVASLVTENKTLGLSSSGGAIYANGLLSLVDSTISDNKTSSDAASGGAIRALKAATITNSTISGNHSAAAGGGISAAGSLSVAQSVISGNDAVLNGGGAAVAGPATIVDSVITENSTSGIHGGGGGIQVSGDSTLERSTVSNNRTTANYSPGGGISAGYFITIDRSTIDGNSTSGTYSVGGALCAGTTVITLSTISNNKTTGQEARGAGIAADGLTLSDSTVSGNTTTGHHADGAGVIAYSDSTLTRSTITDNHAFDATSTGGGLWVDTVDFHWARTLTLDDTILAGNSAGGGSPDLLPSQVVAHYSLIGSNDGTTLFEAPVDAPDANGNLIGGAVHGVIDPQLAPLADNGGPTWTRALLPTSPALDAGDPTAVAGAGGIPQNDQRGDTFTRVVDGDANAVARIDIGAVEQGALHLTVTTDQDVVDYTDGVLSLREAILAANASPGLDTIDFKFTQPGPTTITLQHGELFFTAAVNMVGPGSGLLTIDAHQQSRIFNIDPPRPFDYLFEQPANGDFTFSGMTLINGRTTGDDPGVTTNSISGGAITSLYNGGAIRSYTSSAISFDDTVIENGSTQGIGAHGGAIYAAGPLNMSNSRLTGNQTTGNYAGGGAIAAGNVVLSNCTVSGNRSTGQSGGIGGGDGGGIAAYDVSLTDCTITNNSALEGGGINARYLALTRSTVSGNSATGTHGRGGGVYAGNATVTDSLIANNSAQETAGGLQIYNLATIVGSTINHNVSGGSGGGIAVRASNVVGQIDLTIQNSAITDNTAAYQGGGIVAPGVVTMENSVVARNHALASTSGGMFAGTVRIIDSLFDSNDAIGCGGLYGSQITIVGSTFVANRGSTGGAGAINGSTVTIVNSTFAGNSGADVGAITALSLTMYDSTVTANTATDKWGGIYVFGPLSITNSIVAGNTAATGQPDLGVTGTITARYSIIGDKSGTSLTESHTPDANGNLIGSSTGAGIIDAKVVVIGDHGGHTFIDGNRMPSIALSPDSPAVDHGDPTFNPTFTTPNPFSFWTLTFDGRGDGFARVANGRVDIGAFELGVMTPSIVVGDFNSDGTVDSADYLVWQSTKGAHVEPYGAADGNGDGVVDAADYAIWRAHFGQKVTAPASAPALETDTASTLSTTTEPNVVSAEETPIIQTALDDSILKDNRHTSQLVLMPTLASSDKAPDTYTKQKDAEGTLQDLAVSDSSHREEALLCWLDESSANNSRDARFDSDGFYVAHHCATYDEPVVAEALGKALSRSRVLV